MMIKAVSVATLCLTMVSPSDGFVPCGTTITKQSHYPFVIPRAVSIGLVNNPAVSRRRLASSSHLFFFGLNNKQENVVKDENETNNDEPKEKSSLFSFLNRDKTEKKTTEVVGVPVAAAVPPQQQKQLTATEEAARLRSEADKARLEAERMDAELTLRKIERLEKELVLAAKHEDDVKKKRGKSTEDLQREMNALLTKVRGDTPSSSSTSTASSSSSSSSGSIDPGSSTLTASTTARTELLFPKYVQPFDEEKFKRFQKDITTIPQFLLHTLAVQVDMLLETDAETGKTNVNMTELAIRVDKMSRLDFSYSSKPPPTFSPQEISNAEANLKRKLEKKEKGSWWGGGADADDANSAIDFLQKQVSSALFVDAIKSDERLKELREKDYKALAKLALEYEYYTTINMMGDQAEKLVRDEAWMRPILGMMSNETFANEWDGSIDGLYPKCTTKLNAQGPSPIPTEAQVQQLITDILPKANFKTTSKPIRVLGGYMVRGSTTLEGDAFINNLDAAMERSSLKDKMTVLYTQDFSMLTEEGIIDPASEPPVLYIVSPNICRDPKPVQLSIVTGLGIATSWYLSVYPFLLNPAIATRVDEQLAIADANMVPDLAWLTDLSFPLFATFMGIQLIHELGHFAVARANGFKTSAPTFVPSIFTGITSSVTTFKSPPKNNAAMFDFAVAGPLAGMAASLLALAVGSQLTAISDPSLLPALPLEILRQSTLGGGIIEQVLGNGILYVSEGALGTAAVAGMTVPLHPIAIAGYISLIVNALAVLPIGTTDGGRVAIPVFGRATKVLIGSIAFFVMLVLGVLGSDLFLFYFSFCIAFQAGNEIPARNEVDKLDLPRIFGAAATYIVAALAIIPFQ